MAKKKTEATSAARCSVVVCHGCCCARDDQGRRDPTAVAATDQLRTELSAHGGDVVIIDCLGPCEHRDVVVVRPSREGRAEGGRPVWFSEVNAEVLATIPQWVADGGPGLADVPEPLGWHRFTPARKHREGKDVT